ncbi:MAG: hypothetical protein ABSF26_04730 [Thermoguttaceae bacterium]|jgi:hypothetical protein
MIVLAALAVIPVGMLVLTRRFLRSWFLSCILGITVLWMNMVLLELKAVGSDFDIVFGVAMVMWAAVLAIVYAAVLSVMNIVFRGITRGSKHGHT